LSHHVRSRLGHTFRFVELAQDINSAMPGYVCRRLQDLLNERSLSVKGSRIVILGVTYKPNVADSRESPSRPIAATLLNMGANLTYWDPYVPEWNVNGVEITHVDDLDQAMARGDFDAAVLLQQHNELDTERLQQSGVPIFDTRAVLDVADTVERL
jgi:UDP-N-acetyl-D-glucosamine dehydrogenase